MGKKGDGMGRDAHRCPARHRVVRIVRALRVWTEVRERRRRL